MTHHLRSPREIREHRRRDGSLYLGARVILDGKPGTLVGFGDGEPCFDVDMDDGEKRWVHEFAALGPDARLRLVS